MSHSSSSSSHNYFIWIFIFIKNSFFFFITACDKHITSIIVLLVNSWLDLTDWLYLHSNKKIRCRAWANFSNYIFPLTIILFLLKTGGLIVKLINPMFLSGNEWIADIKPNFSIASISLFPTFFENDNWLNRNLQSFFSTAISLVKWIFKYKYVLQRMLMTNKSPPTIT